MNKFIKSLRIVVMPKLSPTMSHGTIVNMTLQPKQIVSSYDKIMEVSTHSLLNTSEEQSTMDIEVMEDMFVAKVMVKSGQQMKVGTPIALLCDNEEDIEKAENWEVKLSTKYL